MDHVEDVSPHELHHAAVPNVTVDHWEYRDLLALGMLTSFLRHSQNYGITLTKLIKRCPGQGATVLSKAYNALIDERFLARIEFTYARPDGSTDRSGQRYTKHVVSRVPISDESFLEIVAGHAPGKFVMIHYGEPDPETRERELRRVKVLAAEIYCDRGALRILRDEAAGGVALVPHEKSRRGPKPAGAKRTQPTPRAGRPTTIAEVQPELEKPSSGLTCGNVEDRQVQPELDPPELGGSSSIKKTDPRQTEISKTDGGRPAAPRTPAAPQPAGDIRSGSTTESKYVAPLTCAPETSDSPGLTEGVDELIRRERETEYDRMDRQSDAPHWRRRQRRVVEQPPPTREVS